MTRLSTLEVYERWAPEYSVEPHNPLMVAEQQAMLARFPDLAGRDVLDLACGTGRYSELAERAGARLVVSVDFSTGMLLRARTAQRIRADMHALPLRAGSVDVVLSGLALGHGADLGRCVREIARVLRPRGTLLYSDFHPEATARGLRRAFRDAGGNRFELPVDGHSLAAHHESLRSSGFGTIELFDIRAGIELTGDFPGAADFYREWYGTPLAFVVSAQRDSR